MKKQILFYFILFCLLAGLPVSAHEQQQGRFNDLNLTVEEQQWLADHPVIRVGPDCDFPPLESLDNQGNFSGIFIDFLKLLEKKISVKFEIVTIKTWSEVLDRAQERSIDMTGAACATPSREKYLHFTLPFVEFPAVVIVRDNMEEIPSMQALMGHTVAVVRNYADHEYMKDNYPEVDLEPMPDIVSGLRAVSFGHVDAMILNLASATYYIEKEGITNLRSAIDSGYVFKLSFATRSDWPLFHSILQKAAASITPEERQGILSKWMTLKQPGFRVDRKTVLSILTALAFFLCALVLLWNMTLRRQVSQRTLDLEQELVERKKIEKHLEESRRKFHSLFESASDAVFVYQPSPDGTIGNFIEVNSNACRLLGCSREELLRLGPKDFVIPEFIDRIPGLIEQLHKSGRTLFELTLIGKNGQKIPAEISDSLLEFEGHPTVISTVRDIRQRRRMEEELLKAKKLESIGVLAGGIAHDFNNILAAILGNINVASHILGSDNKIHEMLIAAEKACMRAKDLTQQLLTFAKGGAPIKETSDIKEVIRDSADFVLHGANVACQYDLADNLWLTPIDKGQISQVIQNITLNAAHSMPHGGVVDITAENVVIEPGSEISLPPGIYIQLSIRDTGIGISEKHLASIFDPYFTTKNMGASKGSGLGLAVAHSIVSRHGGLIDVASKLGEGTTFTVYLPATEEEKEGALAGADQYVKGQGKILVMDDEEIVRDVAMKMLSHMGYEVQCVAEGKQAIDCYTEVFGTEKSIDLVIMDLTVPGGMGGREAAGEIMKIDPEAKVIVASGYSNDEVLSNYKAFGFKGVVNKPFLLADLSRVIARVMSG
ncbi:MAG: transporter substrate-binding domain-containing protein [Desulfobulbaceae bacterium]|nr:transporter substrate-binding domain-containing protein [Desulfobulbaceae bacterium]